MRILAVSNLYPPDYGGGYELQCRQTVEGLRRLGHHVEVLTSATDMAEPDPLVHRVLRIHEPPPPAPGVRWEGRRVRTYLDNYRAAQRVTDRVKPDLTMGWAPLRIGLHCLAPACAGGVPSVLFAGDWSIVEEWQLLDRRAARCWGERPPLAHTLVRRPLRRIGTPLRFDHIVFVSKYLLGTYHGFRFPAGEMSVINQGARFTPPDLATLAEGNPDSLLYLGRLERVKGVHVAIDVLRLLRDEHGRTGARLTIVGGPGPEDTSYPRELEQQVESLGLTDQVTFAGKLQPAEISEMLPRHRVMLSTSLWEEPGPATPIEAMGHGVPVVTTDAGGIPEYVRDGVEGFVVPRDGPERMAAAVARLLEDPDLWRRVRVAGWERVVGHLSEERYLRDVDDLFSRVRAAVGRGDRGRAP
jgi:glycosyltransferase involved in cell wall biosynthesis